MWFDVNSPMGSASRGFAPEEHGKAYGDGKIYDNDSSNYLMRDYQVVIESIQIC